MKVADLKPAGYNPREISEEKLENLKKAMEEFGDLSGIVFNRKTQRLVGGHQRIKNLRPDWKVIKKPFKDQKGTVAVGFVETPEGRWTYREVEWPEKKEKMANLAANKHQGDWEKGKLKALLADLELNFEEMKQTGFDNREVEKILQDVQTGKPDVEFTEELLECHNYVVLYFGNEVDWLQARTLLKLKTVKALHSKKGFEATGIGRVLDGPKAIEMIQKGAGK